MGDKEPRRRKKGRRDSQKKDDVRAEDQLFSQHKSEPRDSDQEGGEEETVIHSSSHQTSNFAKFVFIILFSGLVVSLSVIFISLRDVNEGPIDIFEMDHGDHHAGALHDGHAEGAAHDDHDEQESHENNKVSFEDIKMSIGSFLSLNDEAVAEDKSQPEDVEEATADGEKDTNEYSTEPEILTDQGIVEEYYEDTSITPEEMEEPVVPEAYPDLTTPVPEDESLYTPFDYSEPEVVSTASMQMDDMEPMSESYSERTDFYKEMPVDRDDDDFDQDPLTAYEHADITNEMDFEMRDQLDEIDDMVEKELENEDDDDDDNDNDDNNDDDDGDDVNDDDVNDNGSDTGGVNVDEDDDEEEEDEGSEEEFDFWQF